MKISSTKDILIKSYKLFFKKEVLILFLKIYFLILPFRILSLFQESVFGNFSGAEGVDNFLKMFNDPIKGGLFVTVILLEILFYTVFNIVTLKSVSLLYAGHEVKLKSVFEFAKTHFWRYVVVSVGLVAIQIAGFVALIVPGIIFLVWFAFSKFIFIESGLGLKACLKKSKALVAGRFWPVFLRLLVFGFMASVVDVLVSPLPYFGYIVNNFLTIFFIFPNFILYKELT